MARRSLEARATELIGRLDALAVVVLDLDLSLRTLVADLVEQTPETELYPPRSHTATDTAGETDDQI